MHTDHFGVHILPQAFEIAHIQGVSNTQQWQQNFSLNNLSEGSLKLSSPLWKLPLDAQSSRKYKTLTYLQHDLFPVSIIFND